MSKVVSVSNYINIASNLLKDDIRLKISYQKYSYHVPFLEGVKILAVQFHLLLRMFG